MKEANFKKSDRLYFHKWLSFLFLHAKHGTASVSWQLLLTKYVHQ